MLAHPLIGSGVFALFDGLGVAVNVGYVAGQTGLVLAGAGLGDNLRRFLRAVALTDLAVVQIVLIRIGSVSGREVHAQPLCACRGDELAHRLDNAGIKTNTLNIIHRRRIFADIVRGICEQELPARYIDVRQGILDRLRRWFRRLDRRFGDFRRLLWLNRLRRGHGRRGGGQLLKLLAVSPCAAGEVQIYTEQNQKNYPKYYTNGFVSLHVSLHTIYSTAACAVQNAVRDKYTILRHDGQLKFVEVCRRFWYNYPKGG